MKVEISSNLSVIRSNAKRKRNFLEDGNQTIRLVENERSVNKFYIQHDEMTIDFLLH